MDQNIPARQVLWLYLFIGIAVTVNFTGLFVTIIGPDGALYATIAKTMVLKQDYLNLYANGTDWLDKPHFPFWLTALSFNLFGFTTWAYKLPGVLLLMMGAIYTYRFAKSLYNQQVALWAVLILLTAQHIVLSNNDVRAEPYLTGLIIAAVYHFYKADIKNNYWHLLAACVFTACAIMTKGMFALVPVGGAVVGHLVITKQWKQLLSLKWLIALILIAIFILPELYCLHQQFDIHPEKVVFGQKGVSGIKFFFWDSQFGRFFNTGPIKGGGDPTFFIHTTLWAFLPWPLLLFAAIFQFIKKGIKSPGAHEWYCISGALLTFLLFSASKFQLPHYLNIIFPFFAILTAQFLYGLQSPSSIKAVRVTQLGVITIMLVVMGILEYYFRPGHFTFWLMMGLALVYIGMVMLPDLAADTPVKKIIIGTVLASFIVNLYLNEAFYPSLVEYQGSSVAAGLINRHNVHNYAVVQSGGGSAWPLEFYLNQPLYRVNADTVKTIPTSKFMLYTTPAQIVRLRAKGWKLYDDYVIQNYPVTRLKMQFLNAETREKALDSMQIVFVNAPLELPPAPGKSKPVLPKGALRMGYPVIHQ